MKSHGPYIEDDYSPTVISWKTHMAEFLQIEISPSYIFRIKIDKELKEEEEVI